MGQAGQVKDSVIAKMLPSGSLTQTACERSP